MTLELCYQSQSSLSSSGFSSVVILTGIINKCHQHISSHSAVVTITSKVNRNWSPPVDLKPTQILKPKLEWMITSWIRTTLPIFVEISPMGSAPVHPIFPKYNQLVTFLPFPESPSLFLVFAYSKNGWTDFHDVYLKRRGFTQGCAIWGFWWGVRLGNFQA